MVASAQVQTLFAAIFSTFHLYHARSSNCLLIANYPLHEALFPVNLSETVEKVFSYVHHAVN